METISILNLISAIVGFAVSLLLMFSPGQNRYVNRFLGIAFFASSFRSFSLFAIYEHLSNNNFLIGTISFVFYLIPAGFYLYFKAVIRDEQRMRKKDLLHFIPAALALLLLVYYYLRSYFLFGYFHLPENQIVKNDVQEFSTHILPKYHALLVYMLCLLYTILSWIVVARNLGLKKSEHLQVKTIRNWLWTLLVICSLLLIIVTYNILLIMVFNVTLPSIINPDFIRPFVLIFIFSRVLFKPELLFGIPKIRTSLPVVDEVSKFEILVKEKSKLFIHKETEESHEENTLFDTYGWVRNVEPEKQNSNALNPISIESDRVLNYIFKINKYLLNHPYINPNFSMKSISTELGIPLYHIEYLFRYYNKNNFSEFRNQLRVNYVMQQLAADLHLNFTIEAIGLGAGFSSRSSFFRVFKSLTGKTPKQIIEKKI